MPEIGEIRKGFDAGKNHRRNVIWAACIRCGKERWVKSVEGQPQKLLCISCGVIGSVVKRKGAMARGDTHYNWKGGYITKAGYKVITLPANSPYITMAAKDHSIKEHRLVMAQHLGRILLPSEVVHHINGIKDDNRLENLELYSPGKHTKKGNLCRHCELLKEIRLLRWQVKELTLALQLKLETEPQATIATNLLEEEI